MNETSEAPSPPKKLSIVKLRDNNQYISDHEGTVLVPEYMSKNQNLLDQPPYTWFAVSSVLPDDFFVHEEEEDRVKSRGIPFMHTGMIAFIRALALNKTDRESWKVIYGTQLNKSMQDLKNQMNPKYLQRKNVQHDMWHIIKPAVEYFDEFPASMNYLKSRWDGNQNYFELNGTPHPEAKAKVSTYAATAAKRENFDSLHKDVGIDLETAFMRNRSKTTKLPKGKKNANKYYRMVVHSEAMS